MGEKIEDFEALTKNNTNREVFLGDHLILRLVVVFHITTILIHLLLVRLIDHKQIESQHNSKLNLMNIFRENKIYEYLDKYKTNTKNHPIKLITSMTF